jgi:transcriptional regulator with GAF, ATPase, and Fis domain
MEGQAKLLHAIETGEYAPVGETRTRRSDARIVSISNEDLGRRVREGTFREDLFFRLNVVPISIPPLRDRKADLPLLVEHFAAMFARMGRLPRRALEPAALEALARYDFPGNVRELRNVLERAMLLEVDTVVRAATIETILEGGAFPSGPRWASQAPSRPPDAPASGTPADDLRIRTRTDALQRELLREALRRTGNRKTEAAALLGVDPRNLAYYLRKHGFREGDP